MKIKLNGNEFELTEDQAKEIAEKYGNKKEEKTIGIAIMSRWVSGEIKYQSTKTTLREAVIEATNSGADLRDANLCGADLPDLQYAKFYGIGGTTKIKKSQINDFLSHLGVIAED